MLVLLLQKLHGYNDHAWVQVIAVSGFIEQVGSRIKETQLL